MGTMFDVIRRCDVCEDNGCNCDRIPVTVGVDEIADYLRAEAA